MIRCCETASLVGTKTYGLGKEALTNQLTNETPKTAEKEVFAFFLPADTRQSLWQQDSLFGHVLRKKPLKMCLILQTWAAKL